MSLNRPLTVLELINIQKMFASGLGYKDLIRSFKEQFHIDLPKAKAKEFMATRSWHDVILYLTGEEIEPPDAATLIPSYDMKHYLLLDKMIELYQQDKKEQDADLDIFEKGDYYIDEKVKFFNLPLYGEIITYRFKEPFLKCFLLDKGKVKKIEDVPITDKLPEFLLRIVRKINSSVVRTEKELKDYINDPVLCSILQHVRDAKECENKTDITESDLFKKYNFKVKV